MGQVIKKENITISIGEYQKDGQTKQRYKTIGEMVTFQNDDGSISQFGEMWGPSGVQKFNVYEQRDNRQQGQAPQQGYQQQAPQGYQQSPQSQSPQGFNPQGGPQF